MILFGELFCVAPRRTTFSLAIFPHAPSVSSSFLSFLSSSKQLFKQQQCTLLKVVLLDESARAVNRPNRSVRYARRQDSRKLSWDVSGRSMEAKVSVPLFTARLSLFNEQNTVQSRVAFKVNV